jgi:protease I
MVIPPHQFRDEELNTPRQLFVDQGFDVTVASTKTGVADGMLGATETVEHTIDDLKATDFDALVIVGGMGSPEHLWQSDTLREQVKAMASANGKVVASICLSGAVLGLAGVLNGKKATVYEIPESRHALEDNGATFTGQPVTVDGSYITANGPEAASEFAQAIIKALQPVAAV